MALTVYASTVEAAEGARPHAEEGTALDAPLRRVVAPSERHKTVIASACRSIVVNRLTATLMALLMTLGST